MAGLFAILAALIRIAFISVVAYFVIKNKNKLLSWCWTKSVKIRL